MHLQEHVLKTERQSFIKSVSFNLTEKCSEDHKGVPMLENLSFNKASPISMKFVLATLRVIPSS